MAAVGSQEALLGIDSANWGGLICLKQTRSSGQRMQWRNDANVFRAHSWPTTCSVQGSSSRNCGSAHSCSLEVRRWNGAGLSAICRGKRRLHKAVADNRSLVSIEEWDQGTAVLSSSPQDYPLDLEQVDEREHLGSTPSNGASANGSAAELSSDGHVRLRTLIDAAGPRDDRGNGGEVEETVVAAALKAHSGNGSLAGSGFVDLADVDFARSLRELAERGGGDARVGGEVEYVEVEGTCTFWQAMLNAVNILLGVGLLTIPFAMSQGGWSALGVLAFLGIVTNYTGKLLGRCQSSLCLARGPSGEGILERGLRTYEDIGEAAFGEAGRKFITGILYTELVGTCGLFFILEGDNLATLFGGDPKVYMVASALVLLPTTWLPDLSALAALGALGALASFSVLGVVLYSYISGGFPVGPDTALLHLQTLPLTFGLLAFVYAGHAVFPNIQASMKEPELYPQMLDYTYVAVGTVCALVGAVGYQMFGSNAMEEITLNLPAGAVTMIATSLIIINPFTKFALTMEPVAQGLEGLLGLRTKDAASVKKPKEKALIHPPARILARSALGASALFLATSVPFFGGVMALVGSSLTLSVSVIFPAAAYLALFGRQIPFHERAWNYFIIALGGFCAAVGTYTAFEAIQSESSGHLL